MEPGERFRSEAWNVVSGLTVYWHADALWTSEGRLITHCTWHEACRFLEEATRPITLMKQEPPGRMT